MIVHRFGGSLQKRLHHTAAGVDWTPEKQRAELLKAGDHGRDSQVSEDTEKEVLCDLLSLESGAESHSLPTPP